MKISAEPAIINLILNIAEAEFLEEVVAFYSATHIPPAGLEKALHEAIHSAMGSISYA